MTADDAAAIQNISGYIASGSDVDIVDTAAEILSAGNAILDDLGVDQ